MLNSLSMPDAKLTSDPYSVHPHDSWKFQIYSMKSKACKWSGITVGHLWILLEDGAQHGQRGCLWLYYLKSRCWTGLGSIYAWVVYWKCFSFDLLLIYLVLCVASRATRDRWVFIVLPVVSLIAWLWVFWMLSVYFFSVRCFLPSQFHVFISLGPSELSERAKRQSNILRH